MTANGALAAIEVNPRVQEYVSQLGTNIYVATDKPPKRLAVTSAEPKEGKTSLGLGLAIEVCRLLNAKVVFVEGNLRSPRVGDLLAIPDDRKGLAELLTAGAKLDDVIVSLGEALPDVIAAGAPKDRGAIGRSMNRADLQRVLDELSGRYDHLIIETAAINLFPESQVIVSLSDQALLVVRAGVTSREAAAVAVKRIEVSGRSPLVALNRKQYHVPGFLYRRL